MFFFSFFASRDSYEHIRVPIQKYSNVLRMQSVPQKTPGMRARVSRCDRVDAVVCGARARVTDSQKQRTNLVEAVPVVEQCESVVAARCAVDPAGRVRATVFSSFCGFATCLLVSLCRCGVTGLRVCVCICTLCVSSQKISPIREPNSEYSQYSSFGSPDRASSFGIYGATTPSRQAQPSQQQHQQLHFHHIDPFALGGGSMSLGMSTDMITRYHKRERANANANYIV